MKTMMSLASLAVFSGLSLNLILQFALGTVIPDNKTGKEMKSRIPYFQLGILFIAVLFLWMFFSFLIPPFWSLFAMYFLFFPVSALVCIGLEPLAKKVFIRLFPKHISLIKTTYPALTAYEGLVPASLVITIMLAGSFAEAFILSLFFPIGNLAAILTLDEIHRKSELEWVPDNIRGTPLMLISMGFLSIISTIAAAILLKVLEVF